MFAIRNLARRIWRPLRHQYSLFRQRRNTQRSLQHVLQKALDGRLLDELPDDQRTIWSERIKLVLQDKHNQLIPRCRDAGRFRRNNLVMHNDMLVSPLCYYNKPMLQMLVANKGVHEPEEEFIFSVVLRFLPPTATMIELGAYWAFYSMCFLKGCPHRTAYMVEPEIENLKSGMKNFGLNGLTGNFVHAGVAARSTNGNPDMICVDEFVNTHGIHQLDVLHCDIQGYEVEMLEGAVALLSQQRVSCVFISTHSNELHLNCKTRLLGFGYIVLRDTDLDHTSSYDGLLFACTPAFAERTSIKAAISIK
ncbi:MAG: FkbM family methyltransferase [Planctomyces sp.]|jgi:hypothetical protein